MRYLSCLRVYIILYIIISNSAKGFSQLDTIIIGFGQYQGVTVASSDTVSATPDETLTQSGILPNENAASRFLGMATIGHSMADIVLVRDNGYEAWLDQQSTLPISFSLLSKIRDYHQIMKDSLMNPAVTVGSRPWRYAYWEYFMKSNDALRQRMALALSEILVVSQNSDFGGNAYALGSYYDIMLTHALGNYRQILQDVTYSPAMGRYLTYLNNPKTNAANNQFPDENYAREIMQLFTIGTEMLNSDGTVQLDNSNQPIPTYNNDDIAEFSKIFTGLTWADRTTWGNGPRNDTSYIAPMVMWNNYHEPGTKTLLNGFVTPDRNPIDGDADINDALDNLFNHPNTPPFVSKLLIQRLVTSNPSPDYVSRVVQVFINNGQGVRGDLSAVAKAILLDPEAIKCSQDATITQGKLREPFVRYTQIHKAFNAYTESGNFRNDMSQVFSLTGQRPLASPSVFNFYQQDFQPIGPIEEEGLVAPEFQITDAQTITGYINGLYRWLIQGDVADEADLFSNEENNNYSDEISRLDLQEELLYTTDEKLHILLDRINLLLAHGRLSATTLIQIKNMVVKMPNVTLDNQIDRIELAIYLVMTSPEYLIKI